MFADIADFWFESWGASLPNI